MEEEQQEELEVCCSCGRSANMIEILNNYFGKNLSLLHIGKLEEPLCSRCVRELQQITFDQVFYNDSKIKVNDLQDKCIAILLGRGHPSAEIDADLCDLLIHFKTNIEELKQRGKQSIQDVREFFHMLEVSWNQTHKHKCTVGIDQSQPNQLTIYVRMTLTVSLSEGFAIGLVLQSPEGGFDKELIIPFKID